MAATVAAPTGVAPGGTKSKWTRVATLGFLLVAAGLVLWIVGGLVAGQDMSEDGMFFGGGAVAALIGAGVTWKLGTAGKIIGIVLALAVMVMFFWVAFSLGQPAAFVEFSGAVMFIVGVFTALGYNIGGLVRRNDRHAEATRGETMAMRVMLGIVALALLASAVLNLTTRPSVDAAAATGATEVMMSSFEFEPATFTATADQPTKFLIHNGDAFTHDFAIPSLDIESGLIPPGGEKLVEVSAPAGTYAIYCNLHSMDTSKETPSEDDMGAVLTVE